MKIKINLLILDKDPYRPHTSRKLSLFSRQRFHLSLVCFLQNSICLLNWNFDLPQDLILGWRQSDYSNNFSLWNNLKKIVKLKLKRVYSYALVSLELWKNIIFILKSSLYSIFKANPYFKIVFFKKIPVCNITNRLIFFLILIPFLNNCTKTKAENPLFNLFNGWTTQMIYSISTPGIGNGGENGLNQLLATLDMAKVKAYCVFQDVDLPVVVDRLKSLKNRGIDVKVGLDEDNRTGSGYRLLKEFLPSSGQDRKLWLGNKGEGEVYINFCVVDERRVFFSTAPITKIGLYNSPFMSGYIQSSEDSIVSKFAGAGDLMLNGSFGSSKQRLNQRNHWLVNDTDVGIYLSPEEDPVDFIAKRIAGAKSSIELFTSEFYSNKRISGTSERTLYDIGYEISSRKSIYRSIVGSWHNDLQLDPDANGDCSFNTYLSLPCNSTKEKGTSSDAPRPINSLHYLRKNGLEPKIYGDGRSKNSLNLLVLDSGKPTNMAFISSHAFSSRGDSSHDGMTFVFEDRANVDRLTGLFRSLESKSLASNSSDGKVDANFMDIVISEIGWMGGGNSAGSDSSDEWLEFYNNAKLAINVSNWKLQCGQNGSFSTIFTFPARTIIGSEQYFVVEHIDSKIVKESHSKIDFGTSDAIPDITTDQCRIMDSAGRVIDIAGVNGIPFIEKSDLFGKVDVDNRVYRTMERKSNTIVGESFSNWKTNTHSYFADNFNFNADFIDRTFGSPGYASSPEGTVPALGQNPARSLVINEVSTASVGYIEIFNPTDSAIPLSGKNIFLARDSGCTISSGTWTEAFELSGSIPARGTFLVTRAGDANEGIANQTGFGSIGTSYCLALLIGNKASGVNHPGMIDFVNLGNNNIVGIGGTYTTSSQVQRCPNGNKTSNLTNSTDFIAIGVASPGSGNTCP
jgi:hypothetical protein